jgi:hypothetical protein
MNTCCILSNTLCTRTTVNWANKPQDPLLTLSKARIQDLWSCMVISGVVFPLCESCCPGQQVLDVLQACWGGAVDSGGGAMVDLMRAIMEASIRIRDLC